MGLPHRKTPSLFPRMSTDQLLASSFNDFFFEKISYICSTLDNTIAPAVPNHITSTPCTLTCHMDNFSTASSSSILHLIKKSPTKSCLRCCANKHTEELQRCAYHIYHSFCQLVFLNRNISSVI